MIKIVFSKYWIIKIVEHLFAVLVNINAFSNESNWMKVNLSVWFALMLVLSLFFGLMEHTNKVKLQKH